MHKHLEKAGEVTFEKIFLQRLGLFCFMYVLMLLFFYLVNKVYLIY